MTIRVEQMSAFSRAARQQWEERMVRYIETNFPSRYRDMGEAGARQFIQRAVEKGAGFGIETEGAVAGLIELMIAFGEQFELSPDKAWANRMIANREAPAELRIASMRERMMARTEGRIVVPHKMSQTGSAK
jgi:hypothetical protein